MPRVQRACSGCSSTEAESQDELEQLEEEDDGETVQMKDASGAPAASGEDEATSAPPEVSAAPQNGTAAAATSLIVDDSAETILPAQMPRQQFLAELRRSIESEVDAALAPTGRSTADCPYVPYWFAFYEGQDSRRIERAVHRYAPEAAIARSATEYIQIVASRARRAAGIWADSGTLVGIPDGVPLTIPGRAGAPQPVMRKPVTGRSTTRTDARAVRAGLGTGRPIDPQVKERMEAAFGYSFAHVRTHDDARAAGVAASIGARAFTVGSHVAFGAGEYRPGTPAGDALIAHELAHVIQQGRAPATGSLREDSGPESTFEHEADAAAADIVRRLWARRGVTSDVRRDALPRLTSGLRLQRCAGPSAASSAPPATTAQSGAGGSGTPCPTSVRLGPTAPRNHADLPESRKATTRTSLGLMSQMNVGPGPNHTGHCMKERLTTVSNTCPAAVYEREGRSTSPCGGDRCLDINRYGTMWGVRDGPTAFLDMHRTQLQPSVLEGTSVNDCTVVCEQTYTCDRVQATTGVFRITRHFQAGQYTPPGGSPVHITTGTVTKQQTQ